MTKRVRKLRSGPAFALTALVLAVAMIIGLVAVAAGLLDPEPEQVAIADIVEAISAESTAVTASYLAGPQAAAEVVANTVARDSDRTSQLALLRDLTISQPNLDGTFVGFPDGGFIDVRRDGDSQLLVKTIEIVEGDRISSTNVLNSDGEVIDQFTTPDEQYDPRARPWYLNTRDGDTYWTDPYVFFTSQEPGITYSVPVIDTNGATTAVVGVDIRLADLEAFLEGRRPSENGGAAVINQAGELVAGSSQIDFASEPIRDLLRSPSESIGTARVFTDESVFISVSPLGDDERQLLIVDAPESDFLNDVRTSRQDFAFVAVLLGVLGLLLLLLGAIAVKRSLDALHATASTDALTGLLNRGAFYTRIEDALQEGSELTVMTLDLDSFKAINDQFGHPGGDKALVQAGERLTASVPSDAVLARLGGDEFCIALIDRSNAVAVCEQVVERASGPIEIDGYTVDLQLSAGFVVATHDVRHPAGLLERSDLAMYTAKSLPGTNTVRFDHNMSARWQLDIERRAELEEALTEDQMEVFFQPEVDLRTGELLGAEALLRWRHPTEGIVPAREFVDDLERFDLLRRLLPTVLSKALELTESICAHQGFTIRLNVSAKQLLSGELVELLEQVVGSPKIQWAIEVEETTISNAPAVALVSLERLREMGVSVSIDDFGAGQSSLSALETFQIDALKVAPSFVRSAPTDQPTRSVIAVLSNLAEVLEIDVLATGVQTEEQRKALVEVGYRRGQGYLFSEPLAMADFVEWCTKASHKNAA